MQYWQQFQQAMGYSTADKILYGVLIILGLFYLFGLIKHLRMPEIRARYLGFKLLEIIGAVAVIAILGYLDMNGSLPVPTLLVVFFLLAISMATFLAVISLLAALTARAWRYYRPLPERERDVRDIFG